MRAPLAVAIVLFAGCVSPEESADCGITVYGITLEAQLRGGPTPGNFTLANDALVGAGYEVHDFAPLDDNGSSPGQLVATTAGDRVVLEPGASATYVRFTMHLAAPMQTFHDGNATQAYLDEQRPALLARANATLAILEGATPWRLSGGTPSFPMMATC